MAFNYNLPNQNFVYNQGLQQPNPNWYYQPTYTGGYTYNTTTNPATVPVNAPTNNPNTSVNHMINTSSNAPSQAIPQDNGIHWVQGEAGAKSYPVAPSQSIMLMDSENEVFYIKTVDASGMPLPLRIFDYKERFQEKEAKENKEVKESKQTKEIPQIDMSNYITREEFEKRINGINNSRKGRNNNGKSSVQSAE